MHTDAQQAVDAVRGALAGRRLVWFGIRGEDGEALLELPELAASFSIIAPLRSGRLAAEDNVALEEISGVRPDLDRYDIDLENSEHTREFRSRMLRVVSGRCVVATYRPSSLVTALAFSMDDTMTLAGLFKDRQSAFENKPWVERSLAARGVTGLDWRYIADEHRTRAKRLVADRPQILRASRASGGVGIALATDEDAVDRSWPTQPDAFVAVAPFLDPSIPLNMSGCVFDDGTVKLHPASLQLIGVHGCTDRRFGYCGNDFGAVSTLDPALLEQLDEMGRQVGRWLHDERYRGAFGLDAIVHDDRVYFVEVNARFQGSSALSAEIAAQVEVADLFIDHLAATLGLPATGPGLTIPDWTERQPARSQIVVHNLEPAPVTRDNDQPLPLRPAGAQLAQLVHEGVRAESGAALARLTVQRSVTATGFEIDADSRELVDALQSTFVTAD